MKPHRGQVARLKAQRFPAASGVYRSWTLDAVRKPSESQREQLQMQLLAVHAESAEKQEGAVQRPVAPKRRLCCKSGPAAQRARDRNSILAAYGFSEEEFR
eukprot:6410502-Karenia_brevis.AAC.1